VIILNAAIAIACVVFLAALGLSLFAGRGRSRRYH
jgi:hypothetical protein